MSPNVSQSLWVFEFLSRIHAWSLDRTDVLEHADGYNAVKRLIFFQIAVIHGTVLDKFVTRHISGVCDLGFGVSCSGRAS